MLDQMDVSKVGEAAPVWEKVVRKLRGGAMPPAGAPRPDQAGYNSFATYLETELDRAAAAHPNPGRPAVHRLNRTEYANAIRDLLSLDPDAIDISSVLPADDAGYGFDNIGDVLTVSPLLMEGYMSASRKISRLAVGDPSARPVFQTYDVPRYVLQFDRMSEELPFGSRGGVAVRHYFPVDAEYTIRIRLQRNSKEDVLGLDKPRQLDFRLDGERIKLITVGGEGSGKHGKAKSDAPVATSEDNSEKLGPDGAVEFRFPAKAGTRLIAVSFLNVSSEPENVFQPQVADYAYANDYGHPDTDPAVGGIVIGGPYDLKGVGETPSRRAIFVCTPHAAIGTVTANASSPAYSDDDACAARILTTLARRAFRRPVSDRDIEPLLRLYRQSRGQGNSEAEFEAGIQTALQRVLVDPEFLFRIERDPAGAAPGTAYRISDIELACRLSFFLWSSIPDEQLLNLAEKGRLRNSEVLEQQVRRMLAGPRSKALTDNFAGQWLYLLNLRAVWPNPDVFPDFDVTLRDAFQKETELFFDSMLREDRSVLNLLDADYTFVNERLAQHYGIPNIYGSHFRRVAVTDENRRGLLGQGSILAVTSYATRTAPTIRGKWLLENILGTPPPPPPPNVPSLDVKTGQDGKPLTMRQQMEIHRANPVCASCHSRMDPLGFALENFDATGRWRTKDGNAAIDPSGLLPDGTRFQGPAELRKILLSHPDQFVTTVTEKLLTYATGRGVEYYDQPAIRKIMHQAAPGGYRWSALILGIAKSEPFQMRRTREP